MAAGPKSPFVRPETGLGGRGHFRGETRGRICHQILWAYGTKRHGDWHWRSHWRDLRRPLKFPNLIVSLTRFSHVLEGYKAPLAQFGGTGQEWPRRLVREIRQIWGSVIRPVPSLRPRQCGARPWMCPPGRTLPGGGAVRRRT